MTTRRTTTIINNSFVIISILCAILTLGAAKCSVTNPSTGIDFTILHTNDLHSQFKVKPSKDGFLDGNPFNLGGLAKLKTMIDLNKSENTLVFDAGDWSEGRAYFFSDNGSNMVRLMDAIGYNAAVVGNHDFLNGVVETANIVEKAAPKNLNILATNMDISAITDKTIREKIEKNIASYKIFTTANGIRVAAIGILCTDFTYYDYFSPGVVQEPVPIVHKIIQNLKDTDKADVFVLLSHNTFTTNLAWAKSIDGVNVIISGHSHVKTPKAQEVRNGGHSAYVVETGEWGEFLGKLVLNVKKNDKSKRSDVTLKGFELIPVLSSTPDDSLIAGLIDQEDKYFNEKFKDILKPNPQQQSNDKPIDLVNDIIAESADELPKYDTRESVIANLAADAYRLATGTDIALEINSLIGIGLSPGGLTPMDIMNIQPHIFDPKTNSTWTLKKISIKGSEIKLLLQAFMYLDSLASFGWVSVSGIRIEYSVKNSGGILPIKKIFIRDANGKDLPLDDNAFYSVALHEGLVHSLLVLKKNFGISIIDLSGAQDTKIDAWKAIYRLIVELGRIKADEFEQGFRYNPLEEDLMSDVHMMRIYRNSSDTNNIMEITVKNIGLTPSSDAKIVVKRSEPDQMITDGTDGNESIILYEKELPTIVQGSKTTVRTLIDPKKTFPKPGTYSLSVQIIDSKDGNQRNNTFKKYYKLN